MKYRRGIGIFLINSEKKLWVGKRIDNKNNYWQMPQGGIDKYETEEQAMKREMFEEVGINDSFEILGMSKNLLSYDLPKEIIKFVWNGKYIGQSQRWFFCKFIGTDSMFDLEKDDNYCYLAEFEYFYYKSKLQNKSIHHVLNNEVKLEKDKEMILDLYENYKENNES